MTIKTDRATDLQWWLDGQANDVTEAPTRPQEPQADEEEPETDERRPPPAQDDVATTTGGQHARLRQNPR